MQRPRAAYAGRLGTALVVHGLWLALGMGFLAAVQTGPRATLGAGVVLLAYWIAQAWLAARSAARAGGATRWYARAPSLVGFYIASLLAFALLTSARAPHLPPTYYQSSGSMIPTLLPGDAVVCDPAAPAERGAVVVHRAPPGPDGLPRAPLVKRVVAVGGDLVEVRDGALVLADAPVERTPVVGQCTYWDRRADGPWREEPCAAFVERLGQRTYRTACTPALPCGDVDPMTVPAAHFYVLGDHRDHSADSRVYGPIAENSVLCRVRYVYFSWGPSGVRWERLGTPIE